MKTLPLGVAAESILTMMKETESDQTADAGSHSSPKRTSAESLASIAIKSLQKSVTNLDLRSMAAKLLSGLAKCTTGDGSDSHAKSLALALASGPKGSPGMIGLFAMRAWPSNGTRDVLHHSCESISNTKSNGLRQDGGNIATPVMTSTDGAAGLLDLFRLSAKPFLWTQHQMLLCKQ